MSLRGLGLAAVVLTVIAVTGCSSDPGPPDPSTLPDGAKSLTQNQPNGSTVEGRRLTVVASNIDESGACLDVWGPDVSGTGDCVNIGDIVEFDGTTLRLVATWVDPDPDGDGGDHSKAWVVVEGDDTPSSPTGTAPSEGE